MFPSRSLAVGLNEYVDPAFTVVAGVPLIVGGVLEPLEDEEPTVIENAGRKTFCLPSNTQIAMFGYVPAELGVPLTVPVTGSKLSQLGLFSIQNTSVLPSASLAVGLNE